MQLLSHLSKFVTFKNSFMVYILGSLWGNLGGQNVTMTLMVEDQDCIAKGTQF